MGSIRKRVDSKGRVSYLARVRRAGLPGKAATFFVHQDAVAFIAQEELKIDKGTYLEDTLAKKRTLSMAIDLYLEEENIRKEERAILSRWKKSLGQYYMAAIRPPLIHSTLITWKKRYEASGVTLNNHLSTLSMVFRHAIKRGWAKYNPALDVRRFKIPQGRVRYLTDEEREKLLHVCKKSTYKPLYLIVVLALSTGMRKEEILSLKWSDIDLGNGTIILLKTKNAEPRRVAIRSLALDLMKEHFKNRDEYSNLLFPSPKISGISDPEAAFNSELHYDIKRVWEQALRNAGIENFVFHDLRHSCASYLAMNGATLLEISEVMGHKTISMVKRYAHLAPGHTDRILDLMVERIFKKQA